jgi:hypothetical protein
MDVYQRLVEQYGSADKIPTQYAYALAQGLELQLDGGGKLYALSCGTTSGICEKIGIDPKVDAEKLKAILDETFASLEHASAHDMAELLAPGSMAQLAIQCALNWAAEGGTPADQAAIVERVAKALTAVQAACHSEEACLQSVLYGLAAKKVIEEAAKKCASSPTCTEKAAEFWKMITALLVATNPPNSPTEPVIPDGTVNGVPYFTKFPGGVAWTDSDGRYYKSTADRDAAETVSDSGAERARLRNGGEVIGDWKDPPPKASVENIRSYIRENESGDTLAKYGFKMERLPETNEVGVKNPDYMMDGHLADAYSPRTSSAESIIGTLRDKSDLQAQHLIVNLDDSLLSPAELARYINGRDEQTGSSRWPTKLDRLVVIKGGSVFEVKRKSK